MNDARATDAGHADVCPPSRRIWSDPVANRESLVDRTEGGSKISPPEDVYYRVS